MLLAIRLHFLSTMPTKKDNSYCVKRKTACNSHAHSEIVTDGCAFTLRKTVGMTQKPTISGAVVRDGRLELPTSCSQSKRATNCANPGYSAFNKNLAAHYFYSTEIWWKVKRKLPEMILMMKIMNAAKVNADTTIAKPSSM